MDYTRQITNLDEGKAFVEELHRTGNMFHFEDSPQSIGNTDDLGRWIYSFTQEECGHLTLRVAELYALDWSPAAQECPIGYALTVMGHVFEATPDEQSKLMAVSDDALRAMLHEEAPSALDVGATGQVPRIVSDREVGEAHSLAVKLVKAEMRRRGIE